MRLIDRAVAERGLENALVFVADGWRARLIARLSALGVRPYAAQEIVEHYDACLIQQLADSAERIAAPSAERARFLFGTLGRAPRAVPVPGAAPSDQLAFDAGRPLTPACEAERATAESNGAEYVRYLPRNGTDAEGRLAGDIVYARDFGQRNLLLKERFADRAWYRARVERVNGMQRASIEPIPH